MQVTPEQWRSVVGYEKYYEVSNRGKVRSLGRVRDDGGLIKPRELKRGRDKHGYKRVKLVNEMGLKTKAVHRLVLEAFVGPCPPGMECCHWDGDPGNNCVENLRWDTPAANAADRIRHGTSTSKRRPEGEHCTHGHRMIPDNVQMVGPYRLCRACWNASNYRRKYGIDEDTQAHLADIEYELIRSGARPRPQQMRRNVS